MMPPSKKSFRGKACTECRQQKLRCDAYQDYSKPCSRCRKTGIECLIPESFQWKKRQSKGAMQREIDKLQKQASQVEWSQEASNDLPPLDPMEEPQPAILGQPIPVSLDRPADVDLLSPVAFNSPQESTLESLKNAQLGRGGSSTSRQQFTTTLPRSLDGFELEGLKIDACFSLFFEHYYPYLPVVKRGYNPNQYYGYSPQVFWTIVAIGSRRYIDDPTIMQTLAQRVSTLVLQSMVKISQHVQTIQSLLLLCTWPFPMETKFNDPSVVFAGAAMQLAVQNGLHMFSNRQDFTRTKIGHDQTQETFRAELWGWCKIICQSTSFCSGLEPYIVSDAFDSELQWQKIIESLPPNLYWAQKLHKVLTTGVTTLMQKVSAAKGKADVPLGALIDIFDNQIQGISSQSADKLSSLRIILSRLHIRGFQLLQDSDTAQDIKLLELHHIACSFVETISVADYVDNFALYTSEMVYWTLMLAACIILKIYRSDLRHRTDLSVGERSYFTVIHLLRKRSLQNNDLGSRGSTILTQIWQSKQIFQEPDGTFNSLPVRIRCRGSMGIVYDCHWYWRREFNGQPDPYSKPDDKVLVDLPREPHLSWTLDDGRNDDQDAVIASMNEHVSIADQDESDILRCWEWPVDSFFPT